MSSYRRKLAVSFYFGAAFCFLGTVGPVEISAQADLGRMAQCIDEICRRIGYGDCDSLEEIAPVSALCRDMDEDAEKCVQFACGKIGWRQCDTLVEYKKVVDTCGKDSSLECMQFTCEILGRGDECDRSRDQLFRLAEACQGNSGDGCVRTVCEILGERECAGYERTIIGVARACREF